MPKKWKINIKIENDGTFTYKDNGGNDVRHLKQTHEGETVEWHFVNRRDYTLTFIEGTSTKYKSPFNTDPVVVYGKDSGPQLLARGAGETFPYTVRVTATGEHDDPDIQVDQVAVFLKKKKLGISLALGVIVGFLIWKLFSADDDE